MIVVAFFRWIFGYFSFTANGKFPERFLNICSKRGIKLWKLLPVENGFSGCCRNNEKTAVEAAAEKSGCTIEITGHWGLPAFVQKYRHRSGLLVGAALGTAFCICMSGFIWNINIIAPDGISEYEIRRELKENGLYEGVRYDYEEINRTERQTKLCDNRISWLSINVFGTNAVVELSAKKTAKKDDGTADNKKKVSNLKATADGTVTRLEVQSGSPAVRIGDGVKKGQLLVSGVLEYTDGSNAFTESLGKVFARTAKKITLEMPVKSKNILPDKDRIYCKTDFELFGVRIPASVRGDDFSDNFTRSFRERLTLLGNDLPVTVNKEIHCPFCTGEQTVSPEKARSILNKRFELYEAFLTDNKDTKVLQKSFSFNKVNDRYILCADIITEENICEKSYINVIFPS